MKESYVMARQREFSLFNSLLANLFAYYSTPVNLLIDRQIFSLNKTTTYIITTKYNNIFLARVDGRG